MSHLWSIFPQFVSKADSPGVMAAAREKSVLWEVLVRWDIMLIANRISWQTMPLVWMSRLWLAAPGLPDLAPKWVSLSPMERIQDFKIRFYWVWMAPMGQIRTFYISEIWSYEVSDLSHWCQSDQHWDQIWHPWSAADLHKLKITYTENYSRLATSSNHNQTTQVTADIHNLSLDLFYLLPDNTKLTHSITKIKKEEIRGKWENHRCIILMLNVITNGQKKICPSIGGNSELLLFKNWYYLL